MDSGKRFFLNVLYIVLMVLVFAPLFYVTTALFDTEDGSRRLTILVVDVVLSGIGAGVIMHLLGKRFPALREFLDRYR